MTKAKTAKLSKFGENAMKSIEALLKDMDKDLKLEKGNRQYTLLDRMRVYGVAAKFEAIRAKIDDPEGAFFSGAGKGDDDDEPE